MATAATSPRRRRRVGVPDPDRLPEGARADVALAGGCRLAVVMLDGLELKGRCCVVALGIGTHGVKRPLGLWDGSTESATVATAVLNNLVERGLDTRCCAAAPGRSRRRPAEPARDLPHPAAVSLDSPPAIAALEPLAMLQPADGRPPRRPHHRPTRPVQRPPSLAHRNSSRSGVRRPLDSARYVSLAFGQQARDVGIAISMGSKGDCYDTPGAVREAVGAHGSLRASFYESVFA